MNPIIAVAVGGALGASARFLVGGWLQTGLFPLGTMVINVIGSFLLGLIMFGSDVVWIPATLRTFLTVGVLGGFTTFSTFSYETFKLLEGQQWALGAANAGLSLLLSLGGIFLARMLVWGVARA